MVSPSLSPYSKNGVHAEQYQRSARQLEHDK
jgi:hypothetical protein